MKYEVFTLGKHFLQVHTSKGFTLFANAKLDPNGEVVSYTDKLIRRGGTWVIDTWKFLTVKYFPENPIYCAVFGFEDDDNEVKVNATDIDVDSISGVNGQLVDIGNISLPAGQALPVQELVARDNETYILNSVDELPDLTGFACISISGFLKFDARAGSTPHSIKYACFNFFNFKFFSSDTFVGSTNRDTNILNVSLSNSGINIITEIIGDSSSKTLNYVYTLEELFGDYIKVGMKIVYSNGVKAYTILICH